MRRLFLMCVVGGVGALAAAATGDDPVAHLARVTPAKGMPFAGRGYTAPYEAVLDRCDVVLTGTLVEKLAPTGAEGQTATGRARIAVAKVLRGKHEGKEAVVHFGGGRPWFLEDGAPTAVMAMRTKDGALRLGGDPPEGGGFVMEGPALAERLVLAAEDPVRGYASEDLAVKLSSAYRLVMAWHRAPADRKPTLPGDIVETLIAGLRPDATWRRQNVNAAARDAINVLLDCNVTMMWTYSVYHGSDRRRGAAENVHAAWGRTVRLVRERRAPAETAPQGALQAYVKQRETESAASFMAKLLSKDELERFTAGIELLAMGDTGLAELAKGAAGTDPALAATCRTLRRQHFEEAARRDPLYATFDPEVAKRFVPEVPAPSPAKVEP